MLQCGIKAWGLVGFVMIGFGAMPMAMAQECDPLIGVQLDRAIESVDDNFGVSVALDGGFMVVGAPGDGEIGENAGAVFVYRFDGVEWNEHAKLSGVDTVAGDLFGISVSISGERIVIGALGDDDFGSRSGSAYVFEFDGAGWGQVAKLTASDAGSTDFFGGWVSISGDWLIAGANRNDENGSNSGAAYIFGFDGSQWVQDAKLMASDGVEFGEFGISVSISGDCAVVGATGDPVNGVASGSSYVFRFDGNQWVEESKLIPDDGAQADFFGEVVSVDGDRAIIGARWDDDSGSNSGSAYVFEYADGEWAEHGKLTASDGASLDVFGFSAAISGDLAIVSALQKDDSNPNTIKAYLFAYNGIGWVEQSVVVGVGAGESDNSSNAVALSGGTALIGSINALLVGQSTDIGSAHVYDISCFLSCVADLNSDGVLDFFDISGFLTAFGSGDSAADFTGDGVFDFFDISAFLTAFSAGCP